MIMNVIKLLHIVSICYLLQLWLYDIIVYYSGEGTPIGNTPWGFRLGKAKYL